MKRIAVIVFSFLVFMVAVRQDRAADLVVSNNAVINLFGDSQFIDDQFPNTGYRYPDFLESYFQLNYPGTNIHIFNLSRSGGTMDDRLTNIVQKTGLALWGYQSNNFQHIGISLATDNSGLSSNQMYLAQSNIFLAPALMSDGDLNLTTHTGWSANHPVQWIGLGSAAVGSTDGDPIGELSRNNASTNAGWVFGIRGIDLWYHTVLGVTNDWINFGGVNAGWIVNGHPGPGQELAMTFATLRQITTDTNISTATVDWNSTTPVATNHCVISSIGKSGNALTFIRHDDRLPFAWDATNDFSVFATNDCSGAFVLNPADADFFKFTIQVNNLPAGTWAVNIDGVTVATLPHTALIAGWNMFTNTVGPYWAQRTEVLGRVRDKEHVDRTSHIPGSAGDGVGMVSYGSNAGAQWASPNAKRGDDLIAALDFKVKDIWALDALTATAAVPTNHTFSITMVAPRFAPAHR